MRRFVLVLAGMVAVLTASGIPAAAATATATATAAACAPASAATYRHSFNGAAGKVTITATKPLCSGQSQAFSVISYTTGPLGSAKGQFVYDSAQGTIKAGKRTLTLDVAVPACYFQVDAIVGTGLRTETTSTDAPYGTATLGSAGSRSTGPRAWHAGGTTTCTATPIVSFVNACDGTFTATLVNDDDANTQAVFLVTDRRIRLSPGRRTTVKGPKNGTLTIRTSDFTTYVGSWRTPSTTCTAPTQPKPAQVQTPSAAPSRTTTVAASPSASGGTGGGSVAEPPGPAFSTNPAAFEDDDPAALAATGMGVGSVLAIVAGLLMIGGGVTVLTYLVRNSRA